MTALRVAHRAVAHRQWVGHGGYSGDYCFGTMEQKVTVIPAKAGIQYRRSIADWTLAFAGVTNSNIITPHQEGEHRAPGEVTGNENTRHLPEGIAD